MKYLKFILLILMLFTTNVFANNYSVDLSASGKINIELTDKENNELIDKVKLGKDNNWEYTWLDIEKSDYNVLELNIPKGYIATYEEIDNTFIITNTKTLVQTGNNYYLVVILGSCGIILILSSIIYNKYKEHNE